MKSIFLVTLNYLSNALRYFVRLTDSSASRNLIRTGSSFAMPTHARTLLLSATVIGAALAGTALIGYWLRRRRLLQRAWSYFVPGTDEGFAESSTVCNVQTCAVLALHRCWVDARQYPMTLGTFLPYPE